MKIKKLFFSITAPVRFVIFWLWVLLNIPFIALARGGARGVKHFGFVMRGVMKIAGIKTKINGQLTAQRPLLIASNHFSVFEFGIYPAALGASMIGKKEIESFPFVGWAAKKFGVIFVDRRLSAIKNDVKNISNVMAGATYPLVLFPEGTTTNGAYVKEFKSSLFNFIEPQLNGGAGDITIVPVVMNFRDRAGAKIDEQTLANDYAYFSNEKHRAELAAHPEKNLGPVAQKEREYFSLLYHIMKIGGMTIELNVMSPVPLGGITDRKELGETLHKIISEKYMEVK